MTEELLRAKDFRVKTFQTGTNDELDAHVNGWLQKQTDDIVVYKIMVGHEDPNSGFTMTIAFGNKPR
ncbi:hypothetical protein ACFLYB_03695 [Chloroflexota bacterium]